MRNEKSEKFVLVRYNSSNLYKLDIDLKSLMFSQSSKHNSFKFLFFSKNEISEIIVLVRSNNSKFSK